MLVIRSSLCMLAMSIYLVGCVQSSPVQDPSTSTQQTQSELGTLLSESMILDLSHSYDDKTMYWPTSPSGFELKTLASGVTEKGYFYSANVFSTPEHGGTHIDAPIHFGENKQTVEQIPIEKLMGPAVLIDVSDAASKNPDHKLQLSEVRAWEEEHGEIPEKAIIVLRTGWSKYWGNQKAYFGDDTPGDASNLHFPSFGEEAVDFLVNERKIVGLGVDTPSIDNGSSEDFLVHRIVAEANVFGLENLTNLSNLPASGATLVALPMKIAKGSGAPVRVIAILPKSLNTDE